MPHKMNHSRQITGLQTVPLTEKNKSSTKERYNQTFETKKPLLVSSEKVAKYAIKERARKLKGNIY